MNSSRGWSMRIFMSVMMYSSPCIVTRAKRSFVVTVSSGLSTGFGVPLEKYFTRNACTSAWCDPPAVIVASGSSAG